MAEYKRPQITIEGKSFDILSFDEFKTRKELYHLTNPAIGYNLDNDLLDFTKIGRFRYIIWNAKAKNFTVNSRRRHHSPGVI